MYFEHRENRNLLTLSPLSPSITIDVIEVTRASPHTVLLFLFYPGRPETITATYFSKFPD